MLKLQEEKEKVKTISPFSRREREMLNPVPLFWEEKEKSRVHNFREEKEKFSFSDIKYPPKTSLHNSFPPNLKPWKCIFLSKNMKHFSQEEKEKQRTESHKSRVERDFCLHNLENREEKENWFKESCKSRQERDLLSKNLENREEKEKWKYNSPARERKTWVISSRDFLEIETLVNDCWTLMERHGPWDVINFLKSITNSFQHLKVPVSISKYKEVPPKYPVVPKRT